MQFSPNFLLLDLFGPDAADLDVLALSMPDVADLVPDLERGDVAVLMYLIMEVHMLLTVKVKYMITQVC